MSTNRQKYTLLFALAGLSSVAAAIALVTRRALHGALPAVDGDRTMPGLRRPVEVIRDRWGVPHIYAQTEEDLFFAQGYVHAQDRLFQMDAQRRVGYVASAKSPGRWASTATAWRASVAGAAPPTLSGAAYSRTPKR